MLGSQLELCRPQFGYIVVLLPLIVILKVHKSLYFVTSLLLARNFLLASLFSFQGADLLIFFKVRSKYSLEYFDLSSKFSLLPFFFKRKEVVEISGIEPLTS